MKATRPLRLEICALLRVAVRVTSVPGSSGLAGLWARLTLVAATGAKATPRRPMAAKLLVPIVTEPLLCEVTVLAGRGASAAPWVVTSARELAPGLRAV